MPKPAKGLAWRLLAQFMRTPLMLRLQNLEKSLKTKAGETWLLRQINLEISEGEFITFMGPSGAGKSTLLSILGCYDHLWQGDYFFKGEPVHKMSGKHRAALNK